MLNPGVCYKTEHSNSYVGLVRIALLLYRIDIFDGDSEILFQSSACIYR